MRNKISVKTCEGIVKALGTAMIESYWGKKATYLPKTVHFELPACAARNQCCRLDNNARHDPCPVCVQHGLGEWGERRYRAEWRDVAREQFLLVPPKQSRRSKR